MAAVPLLHGVHLDWPVVAARPAVQATGPVVGSRHEWPAGHVVHAPEMAALYMPGAHATGLDDPAWHSDPAGQGSHVDEFWSAAK